MFAAQGGDISVLKDADKFRKAKYSYELTAQADGYIYKNDVEKIGKMCIRDRFHNAKVLGKRAACLLTISDSFVSPEITTAEQRQTSFTAMMKVALGVDDFLEK